MDKASLIIKAFEEDHDVDLLIAIIDSMADVSIIVDELETALKESVARYAIQRLTATEYFIHPYKKPILFTDDANTVTDKRAYFVNLRDPIVHQWETDEAFFKNMIQEMSEEAMDDAILGTSLAASNDDSYKFDHKAFAEALAKINVLSNNRLVDIQISIEADCPITAAFNKLPVAILKDNKYGFTTTPWDNVCVEYKEWLKAGQAILIYEDGSKSLLIREPHTKQWFTLKDILPFIKNYLEGMENDETKNISELS